MAAALRPGRGFFLTDHGGAYFDVRFEGRGGLMYPVLLPLEPPGSGLTSKKARGIADELNRLVADGRLVTARNLFAAAGWSWRSGEGIL